ncbi:hypothetical protein AAG570_009713 [Ranatra chinensis]|uniref:Uncharacterized protein n=1 Tax=Ranatra chinensis TaxID=642074 RepID=A0ABD0YPW0_9HEMI
MLLVGEGEGCSGGSSSGSSWSGGSRRPCLLFPPPPPFPPDEYAYAYYEPSAKMLNKRHSYMTRYGTQENLYEEIRSSSRLEDEVRYVHTRHQQVLDELNLSVEAMLMPASYVDDEPPETEPDHREEEECTGAGGGGAAYSLDSGFSGSSAGTDSLRRQQPPPPTAKKKSPQSFWKKLPGLGQSHATIKPSGKYLADVETIIFLPFHDCLLIIKLIFLNLITKLSVREEKFAML